MSSTKRGFMMYAYSNEQLDYAKLACMCALSIKHNLKENNITLVTDTSTIGWMKKIIDESIIEKLFDNMIISDQKHPKNTRTFNDSPYTQFEANFNNHGREQAYDLSPYDETILIDVDYFVMSNKLDLLWDNSKNILMNKKATDLRCESLKSDERLNVAGIPMYWATVVYFRKCEESKIFFDLVKYIKENYDYFGNLYGIKGSLYRNDFVFSIAKHIINGFTEVDDSLGIDTLVSMMLEDDIVEIQDNKVLFLSNERKTTPWVNRLLTIENVDVHMMNKRALTRHFDEVLEIYGGEG